MNYSLKDRMKKILTTAAAVILITTLLISVLTFRALLDSKQMYELNNERVLSNRAVNFIEKNYDSLLMRTEGSLNIIDKLLREEELNLRVIDLSGRVVFDSIDKEAVNKGIKVDIRQSISYDKSFDAVSNGNIRFTIPIIVGERQVANGVFTVLSAAKLNNAAKQRTLILLIPIILTFSVIIILFLYLYRKVVKDVLVPIKELSTAAENIAAGNYEKKISYGEDSELGKFCSNFEFMRDELKASIEAQRQLEKSRKELVAIISHDLRTPIASIKAYVEALRDGIAKDPVTMNKYIAVIFKKTEALVKLINDLFEHSQAELGQLRIELKECYSEALLKKIVQPIAIEFKDSGLTFYAEDKFPNVLIKADSLRIEQVITNLVQNGKKYTQKGGNIYLSALIERNFLKITVKDNGMGISERDLPFIFEKFFRGEKSRSRDHGGAGLGLSICKHIVEFHGGTLSVESKEGEGSTFSFTIPKL